MMSRPTFWMSLTAAVVFLGTVAADARASYYPAINIASCSYADNSGGGFSGDQLNVVGYSYSSYWRVGVQDVSNSTATWYMYCPFVLPDGSSFTHIALVAYDNGNRWVKALLYETSLSSASASSLNRGSVTTSNSASVQRATAALSTTVYGGGEKSFMIEISFGGAQGTACTAFDVEIY